MKAEFTTYLKQLGVTKPIQERVEYFYRLCKNMILGQTLADIFIDEYLNKDKSREYIGLSFYSQDYTFAIDNFLWEDKIRVASHQRVQDNVIITVENFDFIKANDQSLMNISLHVCDKHTGEYRASKKNCKNLVRIFRKYMKPFL